MTERIVYFCHLSTLDPTVISEYSLLRSSLFLTHHQVYPYCWWSTPFILWLKSGQIPIFPGWMPMFRLFPWFSHCHLWLQDGKSSWYCLLLSGASATPRKKWIFVGDHPPGISVFLAMTIQYWAWSKLSTHYDMIPSSKMNPIKLNVPAKCGVRCYLEGLGRHPSNMFQWILEYQ